MDPTTLCPFCDEEWPKEPSEKLLRLKAAAMASAVPSPRPRNPGGMRSNSFTNFVSMCLQHRYETAVIPHGLEQGWPQVIDFDALPGRLARVQQRLVSVIQNPPLSPLFPEFQEHFTSRGAGYTSSIHAQLQEFPRSRPG